MRVAPKQVLTRYLAKEPGGCGIAVTAGAPGVIETDLGGGVAQDNAEVSALLAAVTARGRVVVADDTGGMIASLLARTSVGSTRSVSRSAAGRASDAQGRLAGA